MKYLMLTWAAVMLCGCTQLPAPSNDKKVIDVGRYEVDFSEFDGWSVATDRSAGFFVAARELWINTEDLGVLRYAEMLAVMRVALPPKFKHEPREKIAQEICEGKNSVVQHKIFPEPMHIWNRSRDVSIGGRTALSYTGFEGRPPAVTSPLPSNSRIGHSGVAFVWFPDGYLENGVVFVLVEFERGLIPVTGHPRSTIETLLGAVHPK